MVESAAGLVEHVVPRVPVRRWVLSFPWPLRLLFAAHPELLTRVLSVVTRALSTALARRAGLRVSDAEAGLVTFIQTHGLGSRSVRIEPFDGPAEETQPLSIQKKIRPHGSMKVMPADTAVRSLL